MDALNQNVATLLKSTGYDGPFTVETFKGGANNRVYRVDAGGRAYLLKSYFHDPADRRERLRHEFAFLQFAWEHKVRMVPEPLAALPEAHLGLYSFIEGRKLRPQEVRSVAVNQALGFFLLLNSCRNDSGAAELPPASESCFRISHHLQKVGSRIDRLKSVQDEGEEHRRVQNLLSEELAPLWSGMLISIRARKGVAEDLELPPAGRCISPSDFGFHNAILGPDENLTFIDFEYAGWDDPAKMVCDFFFQPELPVPWKCFPEFSNAVVEAFHDDPTLKNRISLLMPVYGIKWCCIVLNEFLPIDAKRRNFAAGKEQNERLMIQLEKAEQLIQKTKAVQEELWGK